MHVNIGQVLTNRARRDPRMEALVDLASGERFSYGAINARTNRAANMLIDQGVRPGDRVALLLMNGSAFFECYFACAKIGAVAVPLNWRLVVDELCYILDNAGAKTLVFDTDFAPQAEALHAGGKTDVQTWLQVPADEALAVFARNYRALCEDASAAEPEPGATGDDDLYIMYTSGTTGLPKGVVHTHATTFWALLTMTPTIDMRQGDRFSIVLPLFHVGALAPLLLTVYGGGTSVLMRNFDPALMWKVTAEERITVTLAVPAMLGFMLQVPLPSPDAYAQLRWIMSGASPVPIALMDRYREIGIEIHQVYGLTECCGPGCLISPQDAMQRIGSTGKAFFHTDLRLVDADGRDVPPNTPGEVLLRGGHVMKEYWKNPEATAATLKDGWLHTGDLAIMDEDGFVTIHDRIKDMIISGGENIYPAEIENVVLQHPDVRECAVIGIPSERWGETPLVVAVRANPDVDEASVLRYCDGRLARYKLPKAVEFVDAIPRNPSGKALKFELRQRFPGPAPE
ncbi:MAG: long-chain-fatty-acid--CoA ligase [Alphaproteobacteria bacterium]|nr:long-chain-fatty-acid--CoA ligase [Alphaproteobacteria bacterium]MCB9928069.1 long-chain-fatty-acid--CoA ligase [Alphaproteobacteria bacterium]